MTLSIEQAAIKLAIAVALGAVIGFERQWAIAWQACAPTP
jgi:uncharacterized membrane protein YhiD involved in acid resistance